MVVQQDSEDEVNARWGLCGLYQDMINLRLWKAYHRKHNQSKDLEIYGSPLPPGNSVKSQDGGEDSESDSSDDSCSSSKFESADFQSSLRSFQMSESKRKRLRELEASAFLFYNY